MGLPGFAGQHHRTGFGDIARSTRTIDSESSVKAFLQTARHDCQSAQASASGAALRGAEAEMLDHAPGPLAVKVSGVHHHGSPVAPVPGGGNDAAMPEGGNHRTRRELGLPVMMQCPVFKTQRGTEHANDRDHDGSNERNLHPPPARELGQAGIVKRAYRLGGTGRLRLIFASLALGSP